MGWRRRGRTVPREAHRKRAAAPSAELSWLPWPHAGLFTAGPAPAGAGTYLRSVPGCLFSCLRALPRTNLFSGNSELHCTNLKPACGTYVPGMKWYVRVVCERASVRGMMAGRAGSRAPRGFALMAMRQCHTRCHTGRHAQHCPRHATAERYARRLDPAPGTPVGMYLGPSGMPSVL